jgi:methionyl-tRNA formyltransferase
MNLVFLGTPEFAVPTLDALVSAGHDILEVVTQPDRPKGRKQVLEPSPVKSAAIRHGLTVCQPERIRHADSISHLRQLAPEAMVVVGYGQIIPQSIIDIAPLGIINVHASLLPELRGAAPIQWSIARGHEKTGVTTMRIDAGLDTGDIALKWETPIEPDETAPELSPRLAAAGASLLLETLDGLAKGIVKPVPQDSTLATWAPILKKEDGRIDWTLPAQTIHNLIRGLQPWPGAFTMFRGQSLHLWRSRLAAVKCDLAPGALVQNGTVGAGGVFAVAGDGGAVELVEVQLEGRKRMPATVFANGHRLTNIEQLEQ